MNCGCGRPAYFEVYNARDPHCMDCMLEAVDCRHPVLVRKLQPWEKYKLGGVLGGDLHQSNEGKA